MQNSVITDEKRVEELLTRGVDTVIVKEHIKERLCSGEKLRIKFGIDPTSPHLHLGHTIPLRKLRQFQEMGHQAVLIIGDATAMIGDPTGRSEQRKQLSQDEVKKNKETYIEQAAKIIDIEKTEIHHNGEWFFPMSGTQFLGLTSLVTFQQVMQREDFKQRMDDPENPLSVIEMTYPIMQGYDSVMIKADVEIGGADQLLNLHMGRRLQRKFQQREQDILTVPLLEGTDGTRKMSKSFGNAIPLETTPEDMYGLCMMIPDALIKRYFLLATALSQEEIERYTERIEKGENPKAVKEVLALNIVETFHGKEAAKVAQEHFVRVFQKHALPEEMEEVQVEDGMSIVDILVNTKLATSKTNARQLIAQGGVKLGEEVVTDEAMTVSASRLPIVLQKGKRGFVRLVK